MKKIFSIVLTLVMLACFVPAAFAATIGDVDGDGKINASDARLALRAAVGLENLSAAEKTRADADADGDLTAADARLILRAAVDLAEVSSDGTCIVDKLTAAEKLRDYLMRSGTWIDDGYYYLGYAEDYDGTEINYGFLYAPGSAAPFGSVVFYEVEGYFNEAQVWFNTGFNDYETVYLMYDDDAVYLTADYDLDHTALCYETAVGSLTLLNYDGEESVQNDVRTIAGNLSFAALAALVQELSDANVDIDYISDMHLPHLYD